jgi:outer membrane lipoprotein-sorting protein
MEKILLMVCLISFVFCISGCQESNAKIKPIAERRVMLNNGEQDSVIGAGIVWKF